MAIQDESEVDSVELECLQMIGLKLWDHRVAFEQMRDLACDHFSAATKSPWMPRARSKVSHRGLTSAVVDIRAFLSAKLDLSRFSAAPSARLSHLAFESDGAFPAQC
jgi:hypothetical protein